MSLLTGESGEAGTVPSLSRARIVFSQVVACLALDLLLVDLGMSISFVTMVLPEVLNAKTGLSLNEAQASWFGSIAFLCQPLGSLFSGPILDYFGRKKALFISNVPHLVAWLLLYYSWNIPSLFIANALLGIGTGVMEAPSVTYVGEVSDPSVRGILTTLTNGFTSTGVFIAFFLGAALPWRTAALVSIAVPLASMTMALLVPETPIWLLSKSRQKDALDSLCKLRGWAKPELVKDELDDLIEYNEQLQKCVLCHKTHHRKTQCKYYDGNIIKYKLKIAKNVLLTKETLRPFLLVMAYFFFFTLSGLLAVKPNMVNLCKAFGMDYDSKKIVVWIGAIYIAMTLVSASAITIMGKRKLVLSSMLGSGFCCLSLSVYANSVLPVGVSSYDTTSFPTEKSLVPLVLFVLLVCFTALGIPWVFLSEVFPFRSRGMATGLAAACAYGINFLATKTNYDLELHFGLGGTFALYAILGFIGTLYLYFFLPETENKTLVEIEEMYRGNIKVFADDFIINSFRKPKEEANIEIGTPMLVKS